MLIMSPQKYPFTVRNVLDEWASHHLSVLNWLKKLNGAKANRAYLLMLYCDWAKKVPDELLSLKSSYEARDAEGLLDRFVTECPYPESTVWNCVNAVRSFYRCSYRELQREAGRMEYVAKRTPRTPGREKRMLLYENCFNPRDRAIICVACTSGMALETLSNLKWLHFEEDWASQDCPHISIPPELVKGHGKGKYRGVRQETFLTPLAKRELIKYREWMTRMYGVVWGEGMNVFLTLEKPYGPLGYQSLSRAVEYIGRRAHVPFSIHDGRRLVETALENVGTPRNWIQKIKGRKVRGEDAPYSKPAIEQLRGKYREVVGDLEFLGASQARVTDKERKVLDLLSDPEVFKELEDMLKKRKQKP